MCVYVCVGGGGPFLFLFTCFRGVFLFSNRITLIHVLWFVCACLFLLFHTFQNWHIFQYQLYYERERENFRFMSIFTYAVNCCEQFYYRNIHLHCLSYLC